MMVWCCDGVNDGGGAFTIIPPSSPLISPNVHDFHLKFIYMPLFPLKFRPNCILGRDCLHRLPEERRGDPREAPRGRTAALFLSETWMKTASSL